MTSSSPLAIVILAAGKGTRMLSSLPKVLHPLAAKPMIMHVIETASLLSPATIVTVIGPDMDRVQSAVSHHYPAMHYAVQHERRGTADAVRAGLPLLENFSGNVLILYGDTPLIHPHTLQQMLMRLEEHPDNCLTILGFHAKDPAEYGRLILQEDGTLSAIVEYRDATPQQRTITLCNSGVIAIKSQYLHSLLSSVTNHNSKGEYYLTDIIAIAHAQGLHCHFLEAQEEEVQGVNSRAQLAEAEAIIQKRLRYRAMEQGATLIQPETVTFCTDTVTGKDVVIWPSVVFGPNVVIEDQVEVHSFSHIEGATLRRGSIIGPFARIRPQSDIGENAHIGNFVEIKNSHLAPQVKVNHLSYIGDTTIGQASNIGAGTITCNYDGFTKSKTMIEPECFIGSNSCLVAPVTIGKGSFIAAGSVITKDVPADALAVARGKQEIFLEKAQKIRQKKQKK